MQLQGFNYGLVPVRSCQRQRRPAILPVPRVDAGPLRRPPRRSLVPSIKECNPFRLDDGISVEQQPHLYPTQIRGFILY